VNALLHAPETAGTARFALRPLAAADEALYRSLYCDPVTMRHVGPPLSIDEATRSFRAAVNQNAAPAAAARFMVVVDRQTGRSQGICGVCFGVPRCDAAEIGIMLAPEARGQDRSHESFGGFVAYVFESSSVDEVWVRYAAAHTAVDRMMLRLGFVPGPFPQRDGGGNLRKASTRRDAWHSFVQSTNWG
jgi:RimJ/RimL family protein N-acetyltransferase